MSQKSFRILLCADEDFFPFLPSLEENIFQKQGAYPVVYDLGMQLSQVARLKSEVIKVTPPKDYNRNSASGSVKATHKPNCIQHFLAHDKRDVLYIDADVILLETIHPEDFLNGDICVTPRHPNELRLSSPFSNGTLNSGVIFFKNTPDVQKVVKLWEAECGVNEKSDQMALSDILETADIKAGIGVGYAHGLTIHKLPAIIYNDVSCSTGKLWHFKNAGRMSSRRFKRAYAIFLTNNLPWLMRKWLSFKRRYKHGLKS